MAKPKMVDPPLDPAATVAAEEEQRRELQELLRRWKAQLRLKKDRVHMSPEEIEEAEKGKLGFREKRRLIRLSQVVPPPLEGDDAVARDDASKSNFGRIVLVLLIAGLAIVVVLTTASTCAGNGKPEQAALEQAVSTAEPSPAAAAETDRSPQRNAWGLFGSQRDEALDQRLTKFEEDLADVATLATVAKEEAAGNTAAIQGMRPQLANIPDISGLDGRITAAANVAAAAKQAAASAATKAGEAINRSTSTEQKIASVQERVRLLAEAHSISAEEATAAFLAGGEPALASLMLSEVAGVVTTPAPGEFDRAVAAVQEREAAAWASGRVADEEAIRDRVAAVHVRTLAEKADAAADAAVGTGVDPIPLRGAAVEAAERARELEASAQAAEAQATADFRRAEAEARRAEAMAKVRAHLADLAARIEANGG